MTELRRAAALKWLALEANNELSPDRRSAQEVISAIEQNRMPASFALAWLRNQIRRGDAIHRDWSRAVIDKLQVQANERDT